MKTRDELMTVLDMVCDDVRESTIGAAEVAERLVVVTSGDGTVEHAAGASAHGEGDVVAFVNDSGVPFVEQADDLIGKVSGLRPEAVLLAGTALIGRSDTGFRRVLAVQLFSVVHRVRITRIAPVDETDGVIAAVGSWKDVKPGPTVWAERILDVLD